MEKLISLIGLGANIRSEIAWPKITCEIGSIDERNEKVQQDKPQTPVVESAENIKHHNGSPAKVL